MKKSMAESVILLRLRQQKTAAPCWSAGLGSPVFLAEKIWIAVTVPSDDKISCAAVDVDPAVTELTFKVALVTW